jgi:glycosyltransferase involved in cell wall biosynthesis
MASGSVLINARAAARPRVSGVERWARELESRLPALGQRGGDQVRYESVRPPRRLVHKAGQPWEQAVLPALAIARRAPVLVNPANLAPLAFPRNVVVIHDAAALRRPGWYSRGYVAWQRAVLPALAKRALHLVTVSQFSRGELVDVLGADPRRISVVPGGVDERFHPGVEPARRERPYVLTVASQTARKNLGALDTTARRLARDGIDLVAAGGEWSHLQARTPGTLMQLGHVPDADLPGLYAGALAFVLPSHYEGFGLTVLEAMACGTPVVASDRTALPEVVGDAGILVDPDDPPAIADAVERAIGDERLRDAGLRRAAAYTWSSAAEQVHALIRRLVLARAA